MITRALAPAPLPETQVLKQPSGLTWYITQIGHRKSGEEFSDEFELRDDEIRLLKRTITERISQIEEKPGWRVRSWKIEHDKLVDLLIMIDF